jgi:hypothetical protein
MNDKMNSPWTDVVETHVRVWTGIEPPPIIGHVMAESLQGVARAFEGTRGLLGFEQEPSDFIAALRDVMRKD